MTRTETATVDGSRMTVLVAEPAGAGPFPALVLCIHVPAHEGAEKDAFTIKTAERFAENGYVCAAPSLFHRSPAGEELAKKREGLTDDGIVADCDATVALLKGINSVDPERIAILGHCMGGRVAWLCATRNPVYKAVGCFWGGGVNATIGGSTVRPIDHTADIKCPVIGFFGNDDQRPSPKDVDEYEAALKANGIDYVFHRYDGAGHAFQDFSRPERFRAEASEDAWVKVLAFLERTLKQPAMAGA